MLIKLSSQHKPVMTTTLVNEFSDNSSHMTGIMEIKCIARCVPRTAVEPLLKDRPVEFWTLGWTWSQMPRLHHYLIPQTTNALHLRSHGFPLFNEMLLVDTLRITGELMDGDHRNHLQNKLMVDKCEGFVQSDLDISACCLLIFKKSIKIHW